MNDDDAIKVALALFIETVIVEKDKTMQFDMDVLERVDDEETIVQPKLKLSPQEKAFKESQIRGDDSMDIDNDESMPDINSSDTNTSADTMNNQSLDHNDLNNLRSTSSPLLQSNENVCGLNSTVQPHHEEKNDKQGLISLKPIQ
ncbi:Ulp1-like peptidase [Cucumis melo var. makuwa]|uniref:Ulp1-like peptidase n=1 Tax=Cucumis melo var. makuwa TaxID=1194695 RepID=A0A5D3BM48_CUCMM|nr:Ulp1-like peptidase [Cucumis melo var. makuwa]TYJ99791.1 Ulp1-like peptidase [Cucumis melo var. makuwa]